MIKIAVLGILGAVAGPGFDAKGDVQAAAKKLGEAASYSWTSTPAAGGGGARFQSGPTEDKTEKDGYTLLATKLGEAPLEAVLKGDKAVVKSADGWKTPEELRGGGGAQPGGQQPADRRRMDPAGFMARRLRDFKAPADEAAGLAEKVQELKDDGQGAYSGEMTEEGAKALLSFGRGGRGGDPAAQNQGPQVSGAKGSVKFWIKDGVLCKYEVSVQGKVNFGGREIEINRTTTVEIKDVGSTKVEVPEEAKNKLG